MKKPFIKQKEKIGGYEILHDAINNYSYGKDVFLSIRKKNLSTEDTQKLLDDIGSGSETESLSIKTLINRGNNSGEFLERLLLSFEQGGNISPDNFFQFWGDPRVSAILIKASKKLSDEDFANYASVFGFIGESEMLVILHERYNQLKKNPKLFDFEEFYNYIATSMEIVCNSILRLEPTNVEVAEFLIKLTEHHSSFNRESAVRQITDIHKRWAASIKIMEIFGKKLNSLWKTKEDKLFIAALPFFVINDSEKAFSRIKKIYLKADSQQREDLIFGLYPLDQSHYWLGRLAREISNEENSALISTLAASLLQPIPEQYLISNIQKDLVNESPSRRAFSIHLLSNLSKEKAAELAEEAIKDEPDKLIKGLLKKFIPA